MKKNMKEELANASTIATLTTTLGFMQTQLADIKAELRTLNGTFANKEELASTARQIEERIVRLENQSNLWRWVSPTMSAILAAVLAFFITAYFFRG